SYSAWINGNIWYSRSPGDAYMCAAARNDVFLIPQIFITCYGPYAILTGEMTCLTSTLLNPWLFHKVELLRLSSLSLKWKFDELYVMILFDRDSIPDLPCLPPAQIPATLHLMPR